MNSVVVLDACTIVNIARIDEDDFLEDKIKTLMNVYAVEKVLAEVKDHYVPSNKTSKRKLHVVPYWGGLKKWGDNDVKDETIKVKAFLNYQKKPNGELFSAALCLYLSRMEGEKVLFYTDDYPAKTAFEDLFEFEQAGYIGDSVDLLVFLYWLSPKGQFSKDELEKYLTALRGEYTSKVKVLQEKINHYASTLTSSRNALKRKFEMEGLSADLMRGQKLIDCINKCKKYFDSDKSVLGKDINRMLDDFTSCPIIVEKIGATLQCIAKYGIYTI